MNDDRVVRLLEELRDLQGQVVSDQLGLNIFQGW